MPPCSSKHRAREVSGRLDSEGKLQIKKVVLSVWVGKTLLEPGIQFGAGVGAFAADGWWRSRFCLYTRLRPWNIGFCSADTASRQIPSISLKSAVVRLKIYSVFEHRILSCFSENKSETRRTWPSPKVPWNQSNLKLKNGHKAADRRPRCVLF